MTPPQVQNLCCIVLPPCCLEYTKVYEYEPLGQKKLAEFSTDPDDLPDDANTVYVVALQVDR
jgi:hypothetical protein